MDKARKESHKVAIAMSGGVDSAVVAALVAESGADAFGITAKFTQEYSRCCADENIARAAEICRELGIEHHVVNLCAEFEAEVIEPFAASYISGETPSPCVNCNRSIKFGVLLERARELGADVLATGHYARLKEEDGMVNLYRGIDEIKDQSYFLARLSQEQLRHSDFPLGEMRKADVVRLAERYGLRPRSSRESQDLCFVVDGNHGEWIDLRSFDAPGKGEIVDGDGNVVGHHRGIHHYTIGQRKGLGVALGYPAYVIGIDAGSNRIIVGKRDESLAKTFVLRDVCWNGDSPLEGSRMLCQVRYNHTVSPCILGKTENGLMQAVFEQSQFAITPGQLAVFYDGKRVAGSGWIVSAAGSDG